MLDFENNGFLPERKILKGEKVINIFSYLFEYDNREIKVMLEICELLDIQRSDDFIKFTDVYVDGKCINPFVKVDRKYGAEMENYYNRNVPYYVKTNSFEFQHLQGDCHNYGQMLFEAYRDKFNLDYYEPEVLERLEKEREYCQELLSLVNEIPMSKVSQVLPNEYKVREYVKAVESLEETLSRSEVLIKKFNDKAFDNREKQIILSYLFSEFDSICIRVNIPIEEVIEEIKQDSHWESDRRLAKEANVILPVVAHCLYRLRLEKCELEY